jgi:ATP-dependent Clp protease ATP-binding subunit ClpC
LASGHGRSQETPEARDEGASSPARSGRGRTRGSGAAAGATERLSEHAEDILQPAARWAGDFGRREVDTEHLLLALTESDVVRTILEQFKVSLDDLRNQVLKESPHGDFNPKEGGEIGVSPRVKSALSRAFSVSSEFGHSYVGPEHLLIGLAEKGEGIASDILYRYGLTQ